MNLFEWTLLFKGFPMAAAKSHLEMIAQLDVDAFKKYQEEKRWEIAKYHFEHTPFYKKHVGNRFPEKWEDLPILTKKDFQQPIEELISSEFQKNQLYIANTSGSSGHPFFFAKDKFSHALTWAHVDQLYSQHGLRYFSKQARFYGIPLEKKGYYIETLKDLLANRMRFPVFDLSKEKLELYYQRFTRQKFEFIYGYTSSIVYFMRWLVSKNRNLKSVCPTLKHVITTSELLTPEDRIIIEQGAGVTVVNEYGASETGIIGFQDKAGRLRISEELLYAEINHASNTTEKASGELLLTSLYNKAMPFIRYQIGDVATISRKADEKFSVIESLDGRVNDFARLPSGKTAPGLTFYYISRSILESGGVLKEFIIRQTAIDTFEFDVVSEVPVTEAQQKEILQKMDLYLEPGLKLKVNQVSRIERPHSGKIKHFYYQVPQ